jgi:DNA polymerase-1
VLADKHLIKAYTKVLIPGSNFLARVENNGMLVDLERNQANEVRLTEVLKGIQAKLDSITLAQFNKTVNINSPIQIATLLYEDLNVEKIKGSTSTGKDILAALPKHEVVDLILSYRKGSKALGTYVQNLPSRWKLKPRKWVIGHIQIDGRVHCVYLLHGTVTGRLSSRKPNLQNIPRDPLLRSQFRAAVGNILFEVDLNQAELRCLAELSGDPGLMAIYLDPEHPGLHHEVSVTLFGPDYTDEDKMKSKTVNFGIVYGRTGISIAEAFDLPAAEGDRWVSGWFKRFPIAADFIRSCREAPLNGKLLVTPFGRKRRFGVVTRQNKNGIQNEASNFLHQSIASDITLVANAKAVDDPRYNSMPINVVHDSGLHETLDDESNLDQQVRIVKTYMEAEAKLWGLNKVPFIADAKVGTHWGELKKYKLKPDNHFAT